jgi:tetratricopeptide (TPR) repeat protein
MTGYANVEGKSADIRLIDSKKSVVTIYIDDMSGNQIYTANGFIVDQDGIIVTTYQVVSKWLSSQDSSLFVKMEDGSYSQIGEIISLDEANDIALFSINAKDLPKLYLAVDYTFSPDDNIFLLGTSSGLRKKVHYGNVLSQDKTNGLIYISSDVTSEGQGSPVFNADLDVIGVLSFIVDNGEQRTCVIPIKYVSSLLNRYNLQKKIVAPEPVSGTQSDSVILADSDFIERLEQAKKSQESTDTAEALSLLAWAYIHAGKYNEAVDAYKQVIKLKPDIVDTYNNLGVVYGKYLGETEKSIEAFEKAIKIKPDADIYANLGNAYLDLGMFEEAVEHYKMAVKIKPYYAWAHYGLGISFLQLDDRNSALEEYKLLIKISPYLSHKLYDQVYPQ